jgi:hypothetical protein
MIADKILWGKAGGYNLSTPPPVFIENFPNDGSTVKFFFFLALFHFHVITSIRATHSHTYRICACHFLFLFFSFSCYTHTVMGNFKRVKLEVIWEKRAKEKKTNLYILFVKTVETDRLCHIHTHTHGWSFVGNHTHFFLARQLFIGSCAKEPSERSALENVL